MKNEKGFYDIISSKFENREVQFNAADWKSMKAKIDNSRAGKRRTILFIALLGLLLSIGGVITLYNWNNESGHRNINLLSSSANNVSKSGINGAGQSSASVGTKSNMIANNNSSTLNSENTIKRLPPVSKMNSELASTNKPLNHKGFEPIRHSANPGSQTISQDNSIAVVNSEQKNIPQDTKQNTMLTNEHRNENSGTMSQKLSPESALTSTKTNSIVASATHKTDSATPGNTLPQRFSDEPHIFRGKTNIFSVEAGTEYSGGWQIGSTVQGKGFNPVIGIAYARYLGSKLFLKTGLELSTFGNMSSLTYNYQHSIGHEVYDSVITTKRLYFLRIPVQLEYFVGAQKKSSIGLGGSVWFLLGNSGFATTYQEIDNNPPVNTIQYTRNASLNAYTKVNASVHCQYRYIFNRRLSMYIMLYFEMTSMKENSFFGDNIIERTRGIQVMASYSFN